MQIEGRVQQQNDQLDDHAVTGTGARPAKVGMMGLVGALPSSHDGPAEGGPGHPAVALWCVGGASLCGVMDSGAPRL